MAANVTGIFERLDGNEIVLTHPGRNRPTYCKLAAKVVFKLTDGSEIFQSDVSNGDQIELVGDPATEVRVRKV